MYVYSRLLLGCVFELARKRRERRQHTGSADDRALLLLLRWRACRSRCRLLLLCAPMPRAVRRRLNHPHGTSGLAECCLRRGGLHAYSCEHMNNQR